MKRCQWMSKEKEGSLYSDYHDKEWGVPVHDDGVLFEFLILEGAQAGLSWSTVLEKRENYGRAFDGWDFDRIAKYTEEKEEELLQNGIKHVKEAHGYTDEQLTPEFLKEVKTLVKKT